jgi:acyl dehydratase
MSVPFKERFFEDYSIGEVVEFGDYLMTEDEIIEFATKFDPQGFHLSAAGGEATHFGGLIASGWHTGGVMMRLAVEHFISQASSMGSPGVDAIRWPRPVRPGDRLRVRVSIVSARRSESKPDRGIIGVFQEVLNQDNQVVMSMKGMGMYRCRSAVKA